MQKPKKRATDALSAFRQRFYRHAGISQNSRYGSKPVAGIPRDPRHGGQPVAVNIPDLPLHIGLPDGSMAVVAPRDKRPPKRFVPRRKVIVELPPDTQLAPKQLLQLLRQHIAETDQALRRSKSYRPRNAREARWMRQEKHRLQEARRADASEIERLERQVEYLQVHLRIQTSQEYVDQVMARAEADAEAARNGGGGNDDPPRAPHNPIYRSDYARRMEHYCPEMHELLARTASETDHYKYFWRVVKEGLDRMGYSTGSIRQFANFLHEVVPGVGLADRLMHNMSVRPARLTREVFDSEVRKVQTAFPPPRYHIIYDPDKPQSAPA